MKHISKFMIFESNNLFEEIDEITYVEGINSTQPLSNREINILKSLFDPKEIWVLNTNKKTWIQRSTREYFYSNFELRIYKCDDYWYYVEWIRKYETSSGESIRLIPNSTYYKCDQWEGLISLITTKLGPNKERWDQDREFRAYSFKS